ncbi:MAG: hypothetical protein GXP40_07545 [Chloroflexi bacterium]|nr:hypothetical protein [Chloroflexota bacterium]
MKNTRRNWQASWRDTMLLLGEFRAPLALFLTAILGGGILYNAIAQQVGEPLESLSETIYLALTLVFLQSNETFPHSPFLQAFYFLMPLIGIGILAQGLTDFGIMLFNRRARSKEWEMAVASTFNNHTILVGLGHLGFRMAKKLHALGKKIVVIEIEPKADLIAIVQEMGIPVIQDDGTRLVALEAAGVRKAHTIALCTQADSLNLQMALKARNLNPNIQVVVRIFDDDFAQSLQEQFGFTALSATSIAAPAFAAAAAGTDITRPIVVEGQALSLARLRIADASPLIKTSLADIEQNYDVSVVLLRHDGIADMHPAGDRRLSAGDLLAVLGSPAKINILVHDSQ